MHFVLSLNDFPFFCLCLNCLYFVYKFHPLWDQYTDSIVPPCICACLVLCLILCQVGSLSE